MVPVAACAAAAAAAVQGCSRNVLAATLVFLYSFDPESEAGRGVVKVVIDKITERAAEAAKKKTSDGFAPSKGLSAENGGGYGGAGGDEPAGSSTDTPATQFAKQMPLLQLKLESRACGLLAAWVRDTVVLIDALTRAEDM